MDPACLALVVSILALLVTGVSVWVAIQSHTAQRRNDRRDFAQRLDAFALWYAKHLMNREDPGPVDAYIPGLVVLTRDSERLGQIGAKELMEWAKKVLKGARDKRERDRALGEPLFASMLIATVASAWVRKPGRVDKAIKEEEADFNKRFGD